MDTIKEIPPMCEERNDFDTSAQFCIENRKTYWNGVLEKIFVINLSL